MDDTNPQPDYAWIQNTPGPEPIKSHNRRRKILLILSAGLVVLLLIASAVLFKQDEPTTQSQVMNGKMSSVDAAPALTRAQNFMNLLAQNDIENADKLVSPVRNWEGPLTTVVVESYFATGLDWASCQLVSKENYEAKMLQVENAAFDSVLIDYTCTYTDGRSVILTLDMRRELTQDSSWLFGHGVVRDADSAEDVF